MTQQVAATGHKVGATYHNRYWGQRYTVTEVASILSAGDGVRVRWADGSYAEHCTPLDPRDTLVSDDQREV